MVLYIPPPGPSIPTPPRDDEKEGEWVFQRCLNSTRADLERGVYTTRCACQAYEFLRGKHIRVFEQMGYQVHRPKDQIENCWLLVHKKSGKN